MESPSTAKVSGGRVGGWLMALSPLGYGALVASMAAIFASAVGLSSFDQITRAQMDALGGGWIAARVMVAAATTVVIAGAALVAWTLRRAEPAAARGLAWATVVLAVANLIAEFADVALGVAMASFSTPTLGEDPLWQLNSALLPWAFGAVVLQLLLLCAALWVSHVRRGTGLVMGILTFVVLVVTGFAADSVPPFVVSLLACPVGISWLRGQRRRGSGSLS